MTFIEAWEQALRELGMSEDDIQRRHIAASTAVPITKEMRDATLPEGEERKLIETLKKLYTLMHEHRDTLQPLFERMKTELNQRN